MKDCSRTLDYPKLKTEVKGFWTDTDLYLLFVCPYETLNVFLPADNSKARRKLGWAPKTSFTDLVKEMVASDLEEARREVANGKHSV